QVVEQACSDKCNSFTVPSLSKLEPIENNIFGTKFRYDGVEYETAMGGGHQIKNAVTAIETARLLGAAQKNIVQGIRRAKVAARQEVIAEKPLVLLDGGHNEDGGRVLGESLKRASLGGKTVAVLSMMADKSIDDYLSFVAPLCREIVTVTVAENPRAQSAQALKTAAERFCPNVCACEDACKAIHLANGKLRDGECLLVCGSLYLAGEVRNELKKFFAADTL
ncbi:MAG TPA: hypothetical protein DDY98_07095, partial [Ruminococcaceae bacterium]|nr:hypothetical protein [Oscillospiraceae bacterium]